jgi:hypothetical protein
MSYKIGDRQMQAAMCLLLLYSMDYDHMQYYKTHFAIKKIM